MLLTVRRETKNHHFNWLARFFSRTKNLFTFQFDRLLTRTSLAANFVFSFLVARKMKAILILILKLKQRFIFGVYYFSFKTNVWKNGEQILTVKNAIRMKIQTLKCTKITCGKSFSSGRSRVSRLRNLPSLLNCFCYNEIPFNKTKSNQTQYLTRSARNTKLITYKNTAQRISSRLNLTFRLFPSRLYGTLSECLHNN